MTTDAQQSLNRRRVDSIVSGQNDDPTRWGVSADQRQRLVQLAYRFVWNREDAEDATQDAIIAAHEKREELRDESKWWPWVRRIVVRRSLLVRRQAARRRESDSAKPWFVYQRVADDAIERNERLAGMRRAIDALPDRQRMAVTLRYLEQMSYPEIAEIMELSETTVRVHVCHGLESLRSAMRETEAVGKEPGSR